MEIGPIDNNKPFPDREVARLRDRPERAPNEAIEPDKSDISDDARRMAEEAVQEKNRTERAEILQREKMRLIKQRVEDGYYSRPDIVEKMADRILEEEGISSIVESGTEIEDHGESVENKSGGGWNDMPNEEDRQSESPGGILGV